MCYNVLVGEKKRMKRINIEYENIYKEFEENSEFKKLSENIHHGLTRLEHVNRVARWSFFASKVLKLDTKSVTRGALLHDFFTSEDINRENYNEFLKEHPLIALENSKKYFEINEIEEDIISKHMYPITRKKPKYKESILVSLVDKAVSCYEALRFQTATAVGITILFLYNIR